MTRVLPNVLISGTPGTGKSTLCQKLFEKLDKKFKYLSINEFCKENSDCIESRDEELDCFVIDEDVLALKLTPILSSGGFVLDYHGVDLFPRQLIDVVFITRCNNTVLYDRLMQRNYCELKVKQNIESEIFDVISEEAFDWMSDNECVIQLTNETTEQLDSNSLEIQNWIKNFKPFNSNK